MSEEVKDLCPCGSGLPYAECCEKAHSREVWPETAEAMLRARYSAYVVGKFDFLVESAEGSLREKMPTAEELKKSTQGVEWLSLHILETQKETLNGVEYDTIDYHVFYKVDGATMRIGEHALFGKKEGKLYYATGYQLKDVPIVRATEKVGRNDPCPCGSGKKYKKCCGK